MSVIHPGFFAVFLVFPEHIPGSEDDKQYNHAAHRSQPHADVHRFREPGYPPDTQTKDYRSNDDGQENEMGHEQPPIQWQSSRRLKGAISSSCP